MEQNSIIEMSLPSAKNLTKEAWVLYKSRFQTFLAISLLFLVFDLIFGRSIGSDFGLLIVLLYVALAVFAQAAILGNLIKNEDIGFLSSIKYAADNFDKYLWISVLVMLVTAAGLVLIIPAIIWSISLSLAVVVLAVEGSTGLKALLKSREYVRGRWFSVFIVFMLFQIFLLLIPSIIIDILGLDILDSVYGALVTPLSITYIYVLYKYLSTSRSQVEIKDEKRFKIIALLGLLVIITGIVLGVIFKDFLIEKGVFNNIKTQTQVK